MEASKSFLYRYPGTKPFEANEYELFKGRDEDIMNLYELVSLQSLIVLFGRSGLGKSSLLNAGLVNNFKKDAGIAPVFLRFGTYYDKNTSTPLEKLYEIVSSQFKTTPSNFIFEKLIAKKDITVHHLWYFFKSLCLANLDKQTFILIFDQFEELFTYPEKEIDLFKKDLSELLYVSVPQQLRNLLKDNLLLDPDYLTTEEKDLLFTPLNIRIIFSVRSDKLSLLNKFTDYFPSVLKFCYELKPLNRQQARQAITEPAKLNDKNYLSPPFTFTDEAISVLLNSLTEAKNKSDNTIAGHKPEIETFQLQIVCKYAENLVIEKDLRQIAASDLGNIKDIFENHYRNIIANLSPEKQLPARRLIEEKLIIEGARVSMPISFILQEQGMTKELLDELISTHILRPEQNNTLEISHDTLIEPVSKYYDERKKQEALDLELQEKEEQIKRIKEEQEKQIQEQKQQQQLRAQQLKTRRNKIIITRVTAALILTLLLAGYAVKKSAEANEQKEIAMQQSEKAKMQTEIATQQSEQANLARLNADSQSQIAVNNAKIALQQKFLAKKAQKEAEFQKNKAEVNAEIVKKLLKEAEGQREIVTARVDALLLYALAREWKSKNPTIALRIEEAALKKYPDPMILKDAQEIFKNNAFYKIIHNNTSSKNRCATISRDGKKILTGGYDKIARLWNIDGSFIREFKGNRAPIMSVAFSPDGSKILTGGYDHMARLWDTSGTLKKEYKGHGGYIISASFSPDGTKILTGDTDAKAMLWNITDDTSTMQYDLDMANVFSVAFSKDGSQILTGTEQACWVWNIDGSGKRDLEVRVTSVGFSRDGESILVGSKNDTAGLFNFQGDLLTKLNEPPGKIISIAFSPDGKKFLTGSYDGSIKLWNEYHSLEQEFKGDKDPILSIGFSPGGEEFFSWSRETVRFWRIDKIPMTLEEYLKSDLIEPLTEEQKKEFDIK